MLKRLFTNSFSKKKSINSCSTSSIENHIDLHILREDIEKLTSDIIIINKRIIQKNIDFTNNFPYKLNDIKI